MDPTHGTPMGATISTPPSVFGAKLQAHLEVACHLLRFYETIGRPLTAVNIKWDKVMKRFGMLWHNLFICKDAIAVPTPRITKVLHIIKWVEAFGDHLCRSIGGRIVPLIYVVRILVVPPVACPSVATNQPYSDEFGLIDEDLIARASHNHGLFR